MKVKKVISLLLTMTLLISFLCTNLPFIWVPVSVYAESNGSSIAELENIALNKEVSTTDTNTKSDVENAVDGDESTFWQGWSSTETTDIVIDFKKHVDFDTVVIKQGSAKRDLKVDVEVSDDNINWEKVKEVNISWKEEGVIELPATSAKYMRLNFEIIPVVNDKGTFYGYDIAEIEIYNNSSVKVPVNLALNKKVSTTYPEDTYKDIENAVDGDRATYWRGWTTGPIETNIIIDFAESVAFDTIILRKSGGNARAMTVDIEVSKDGNSWSKIAEQKHIALDEYDKIITTEEIANGKYMRLNIKLSQAGYQIHEIEVYNSADGLPGDTDEYENNVFYGNYLKDRVGKAGDMTSQKILYHSDREMMYDFDTEEPLKGVTANEDKIEISDKYYMTKENSLLWSFDDGDSIEFKAGFKLDLSSKNYKWNHKYRFSIGVLQEELPEDGSTRSLDIAFIGKDKEVITEGTIYLHREGWNILAMPFAVPDQTYIDSVRVKHSGGSVGEVYIDNVMIYIANLGNHLQQTMGITRKERYLDNADKYELAPLTDAEREGFKKIAEKIVPTLDKVDSLSETNMNEFRDFYNSWEIEVVGNTVNGKNPLYYHRAVPGDPNIDSNGHRMYQDNQDLCTMVGKLGKAYNQVEDLKQKRELGEMLTNLVKLSIVYSGVPNPWYNGRGFAEGVYYGKDILEEEGVLGDITDLLKEQYGTDAILYYEHDWENPPITVMSAPNIQSFGTPYDEIYDYHVSKDSERNEFLWHTTADSFNTEGSSIFLSILVGSDTPEKARDLRRLKSWIDNVALEYSPNVNGTLKPDGSIFHHKGNRFDNYGYTAAWRGMTEYVYWLSHTPFAVSQEAHERLINLARVHFTVMDDDGYVGGVSNRHYVPSVGFLNLAKAGTPDGSQDYDSEMASYWLAFDEDKSFNNDRKARNKFIADGIVPALRPQNNITLSYAGQNIHQRDNWQVYTRGVSDHLYYTQYIRDGFLFYNIGGIDLIERGKAPGMVKTPGASVLLRHWSDWKNFYDGYNISRAPGVTSFEMNSTGDEKSKLKQVYYQNGSSPFVGGVSMANGNGLFTQKFDGSKAEKLAATVANTLKFNKSYFYFDEDIICLSSDMDHDGDEILQTGLFQEKMKSENDAVILSGGRILSDTSFNETLNSTETPWVINNTGSVGIYVMPEQTYKITKGSQTFIGKTGNIVGSWIEETEGDGKYAYIMRIRPTVDSMEKLEESMKGDEPAYVIHQQDSSAHIVESKEDNTIAYVVYEDDGLSLSYGYVTDISKSGTMMVKEIENGRGLVIAVSDPDMHMDKTESNPHGYSLEQSITLDLKGRWRLKEQTIRTGVDTKNIEVEVSGDQTKVTFKCVDGLTTEGLFENIDNPFESEVWKEWNKTKEGVAAPTLDEIYVNNRPIGINSIEKNYIYIIPESIKKLTDVRVDASDKYSVTISKPATLPGEITISVVNTENEYLTSDYKVSVTYDTSHYKVKVSDTPQPENHAGNMLDNDLGTYWTSDVDGCWIEIDLGKVYSVNGASIAFMNGHKRAWKFEAETSIDGETWEKVFDGQTSGTTSGFDNIYFDKVVDARYVRFTGHGNTSSAWNSVAEIVILKASGDNTDDNTDDEGSDEADKNDDTSGSNTSKRNKSGGDTSKTETPKTDNVATGDEGLFKGYDGSYDDVDSNHWAYEAINELSLLGKIEGRDERKYAPEAKITRAEFIAFIVNVIEKYDKTSVETFKDVSENDKYQKYIASAYKHGIVLGYSDEIFGTNDFILRQDAVVILLRVLQKMKGITLSNYEECTFLDKDDISPYARDYVASSAAYNLILGYEVDNGTEFRPKENMTRAEAAMLLFRFYKEYIKEKDDDKKDN